MAANQVADVEWPVDARLTLLGAVAVAEDLVLLLALGAILVGSWQQGEWTVLASFAVLVSAWVWLIPQRVVAVRASPSELEILAGWRWRRMRWTDVGQVEAHAAGAAAETGATPSRLDIRLTRPRALPRRLSAQAGALSGGGATLQVLCDMARAAGVSSPAAADASDNDGVVPEPLTYYLLQAAYVAWLLYRGLGAGARATDDAAVALLPAEWVAAAGIGLSLALGIAAKVMQWSTERARRRR